MMGDDRKKKGLAVLIAEGIPHEGSGDVDEYAEAKRSAGEDILSAMESKDAAGLADALENLWSICESHEDKGEESEPSSEGSY